MGMGQIQCHDFCSMLDLISAVFQGIVKIRRNKRADLKDSRSSQPLIFMFAVGNFFSPGKGGGSELLYAIGSVRIKMRKTQDPAVIQFHFI